MLFHKVNIKDQLVKEREREVSLLQEVNYLLQLSGDRDEDILRRLKNKTGPIAEVPFELEEADKKNLFSLNDISAICIKYRLRFLDSSHFSAEIPYEAVSKIKEFEKKYGHRIERFKIIAPDRVFRLTDVNKDPLLLAQLGDNSYYLLHKWGNDLSWYRAILCYPFRNIYCFLASVFCLGLIIGFSMPVGWLNTKPEFENYLRLWLSVHSFIGLTGFFIFVGGTFHHSFSAANWRSKHYNG